MACTALCPERITTQSRALDLASESSDRSREQQRHSLNTHYLNDKYEPVTDPEQSSHESTFMEAAVV
ncbi:unnamed protein product [Leuciscus chuanchicus]